MTFPALLSTAAAGLSLLLSLWLFFTNAGNQSLQEDLLRHQSDFQTEQAQYQLQQQSLQQQQQVINTANTLSQQVGPSVIKELAAVAVEHKDDKIKNLLTKYGVTIEAGTPAAADGKTAPAPAATPAGKPAGTSAPTTLKP